MGRIAGGGGASSSRRRPATPTLAACSPACPVRSPAGHVPLVPATHPPISTSGDNDSAFDIRGAGVAC